MIGVRTLAVRPMVDPGPLPEDRGMDEDRLDCECCPDDATFRGRLRFHRGAVSGPTLTLCHYHLNLALMNGARPVAPYAKRIKDRWWVTP